MTNDPASDYVKGERARGVPDDAIRGALTEKGWSAEAIASVMGDTVDSKSPAVSVQGPSLDKGKGGVLAWLRSEKALKLTRTLIFTGLAAEIAGLIWMFVLDVGGTEGEEWVMPSLFFLSASLLLTVAVASLWLQHIRVAHHILHRLWLWLLGLLMAAFVPISVLFYLVSVFSPSGDIFHLDVLGDALGAATIVNFLIILPVQVIVYLASVITVFTQRHFARKHGAIAAPVQVLQGYALMVLAALIGVGVLWFVLSNISFGF